VEKLIGSSCNGRCIRVHTDRISEPPGEGRQLESSYRGFLRRGGCGHEVLGSLILGYCTLLINAQSGLSLRYWGSVLAWQLLKESSITREVHCSGMAKTLIGTSTSTRRCCGLRGGGHFKRRSSSWEKDVVSPPGWELGAVSTDG